MTQEGTKTLISVGQMLIVGIKIKKNKDSPSPDVFQW